MFLDHLLHKFRIILFTVQHQFLDVIKLFLTSKNWCAVWVVSANGPKKLFFWTTQKVLVRCLVHFFCIVTITGLKCTLNKGPQISGGAGTRPDLFWATQTRLFVAKHQIWSKKCTIPDFLGIRIQLFTI